MAFIDLHRHLDGNIKPEDILLLAEKNRIDINAKGLDQVKKLVEVQGAESDLISFLKKLDIGVSVLASPEDCFLVAKNNVKDLVNTQISYAELRFSPYYMAHMNGLNTQAVVEAVVAGVKEGVTEAQENNHQIEVNLIGILSRTFGTEICDHELDALLSCKESLVALDLAGDEVGFPSTLFVPHFKKARDAGLRITVHAGEAAGPESIWSAIKDLGAERIGHGVAAVKDPELMEYMRKHQIGVESCLTSNYQTGSVASLLAHPIYEFLKQELLVCLNTDDPAISAIDIEHEFKLASDLLKLTPAQIALLKSNAEKMKFV